MNLHAPARTYEVKTHGCQMNVHDSERLSGLLGSGDSMRVQPHTTLSPMEITKTEDKMTVNLDWNTSRDDNEYSPEELEELTTNIATLFQNLGVTQADVAVQVRD